MRVAECQGCEEGGGGVLPEENTSLIDNCES